MEKLKELIKTKGQNLGRGRATRMVARVLQSIHSEKKTSNNPYRPILCQEGDYEEDLNSG